MAATGTHRDLMVFRIADNECALDVAQTGEIVNMVAITPVPQSPHWLLGAINLRGNVVPVIDLRERVGTHAQPPTIDTPIIIAEHADTGDQFGLVVDEAIELLTVADAQLSRPSNQHSSPYVAQVARLDDRLVLVLDLAAVTEGAVSFIGA